MEICKYFETLCDGRVTAEFLTNEVCVLLTADRRC